MSDSEKSEVYRLNSVEQKSSDDFEIGYSDEEMGMKDGKEWEPTTDEIVELFDQIQKDKILGIEWTTPGRRPPTPPVKLDPIGESNNKDSEGTQNEKSDFDFQDDMANLKVSAKAIRPAGFDGGPRGSAKKKTTSLDAILSNMARHRKLDMMEDDEDPLT